MRARGLLVGGALLALSAATVWLLGSAPSDAVSALSERVAAGSSDAPRAAWSAAEPASAVVAGASARATARRTRQLEKALRARSVAAAETLPSGDSWRPGAVLNLPLFDGAELRGVVERVWPAEGGAGGPAVSGRLDGGGTFTLALGPTGPRDGLILPAGDGPVYRLIQDEGGGLLLAEMPRGAVLCASLPRPPARPTLARVASSGAAAQTATTVAPLLESRPEAEPVLYLDFDGQTVNDRVWNGGRTIEAAPSGLSAEEIRQVWSRVAEDYRPFRINVTTDPARYAAARPMQRMRCIITPTKDWYGDVGGVALVFSWRDASAGAFAADVPCWVFSDPAVMSPADVALAISHEAGHTLGLYHDGLRGEDGVTPPEGDYYQGQGAGATAWGPIMGAPYGKPLIQWSRGDYSVGARVANNPEDDVALIASIENHVGFAAERRAGSLADACRLAVVADGATVDHRGLIERAGAEAWLIFATGGGALSLELAPDDPAVPQATNFDGSLAILNQGGAILAFADQAGSCFPRLVATLPAGVYVLRVKSTGEGSPSAGGYSAYGSIGRYRVVGQIPPGAGVAPLMGGAPRGEGRAGEPFRYAIEAAGAGLSYSADPLPPGLSIDANGVVTGVPTEAGVWNATVRATNSAGATSRPVLIAVAGADLARTLDAPALVFTTGGSRPWRGFAQEDSPAGGSCARSGELLDDNGESWIETTVAGPGRLSWLWRVSSEKDYDLLHVSVDGALVASVSGEVPWTERGIDIPAGTHTLRWTYDKDDYLSERMDTAWLDRVRWERGFERWLAAETLSGVAAAPESDPDGDGAPNLLEYAFGSSPRSPGGIGSSLSVGPVATTGVAGEGRALQITFTRPPGVPDVRYVVEVSGDLLVWTRGHAYGAGAGDNAGDLPTEELERAVQPDGGERVRVRDRAAAGHDADRRFIRLRIERI